MKQNAGISWHKTGAKSYGNSGGALVHSEVSISVPERSWTTARNFETNFSYKGAVNGSENNNKSHYETQKGNRFTICTPAGE